MNHSDSPAVIGIDYVLAAYKKRRQKDDRDDELILQLIIDFLQNMNMFYIDIAGIQAVNLTIDATLNIVDLPSDFIDYYRIGRIVNGSFVSFSLNPDIPIPLTQQCSLQVNANATAQNNIIQYQDFGAAGGYNIVDYRIDRRARQIIFKGVVPGSVCYMEYFSTGVSAGGEVYIDRRCVEPIISWIDYQLAINSGAKDLMLKLQTYSDWVVDLNKSFNEMYVDEMLDAFYRGYRQVVKG